MSGDREQRFLLAPDMRDWLPADHLAWFVIEVVDRLDLTGPSMAPIAARGGLVTCRHANPAKNRSAVRLGRKQ